MYVQIANISKFSQPFVYSPAKELTYFTKKPFTIPFDFSQSPFASGLEPDPSKFYQGYDKLNNNHKQNDLL